MEQNLTKHLESLIDETLAELEELKKSRFSAAEIEIKGPGEGIDGKPSNGKLDAKKADDEDKDDKKEDKDMDKSDMDKAEDKEDKAEDKKDDDMDKKEDKDEDKKDKDAKGGEKHEAEERKAIGKLADLADMKKSIDASESLMKSYVEERVAPLEQKLSTILDLVNKIADQPAPAKGATIRSQPLFKSEGEHGTEPLSKSEVSSKLFELKKSGTVVDSLDVVKAEMGQDLERIAKKYQIS